MILELMFPVIVVLDLLFAITIVFIQRKNPTAVAAWLLVIFFIPVLGFVLFLIFGQDYRKRKMFQIKDEADQIVNSYVRTQEKLLKGPDMHLDDRWSGSLQRMVLMLLESNRAIVTNDNQITVYTKGSEKFSALIEAIRKASHHVHLEYFILKDDGLGKEVMAALTERARAGVEVRLLVDGIGSGRLPRRFFDDLVSEGGHYAVFFPSLIPFFNYRINYRNHRKIAVIDGKLAFIGGFNIGDDYVGKGKRWGFWRDTAVKIEGSAAAAAQLRFFQDWNYASGQKIDFHPVYFPENEDKSGSIVQIVSGGPDTQWNPVKESYMKMINSATETVYIQTPYFIPDESVVDSLRIAALSGLDVRIMIPTKPDHLFVYWASHSYIEQLLPSGVRAYTYDNGFLHAKTIVIDGAVASVGSANWDLRSFHLNFETNAVIYDPFIAGELKEAFEHDLVHCRELATGWYDSRSVFFKARAAISRLFSPIL
ncbi:MAG TPA: cardiolipin synthase [Methanoregulaceae archaeon]|nr:cardiolipin synthase [Methanoregulaceae archaeon]